jgi:hypothetical protein
MTCGDSHSAWVHPLARPWADLLALLTSRNARLGVSLGFSPSDLIAAAAGASDLLGASHNWSDRADDLNVLLGQQTESVDPDWEAMIAHASALVLLYLVGEPVGPDQLERAAMSLCAAGVCTHAAEETSTALLEAARTWPALPASFVTPASTMAMRVVCEAMGAPHANRVVTIRRELRELKAHVDANYGWDLDPSTMSAVEHAIKCCATRTCP